MLCRREILNRMSYKSTTGISGLVEKLKNVEAAIKATRERMERRASGLPPLPPPGLTPVYAPTKQKPQIDQAPSSSIATVTTSGQKPRGITSVKRIIGLGRGKKFSKQNSFPSAFDDIIPSDTASVSSSDLKSSSSSSSVGFSQNELKEHHQPIPNSAGVHEHDLHLNEESTSHKFTPASQPQTVASNTVSSSVTLNPIPVVANGGTTINSATARLVTTSFVAPTIDQVAKSFAKLSTRSQAVPSTSFPFTSQATAPSPSITSQRSALIPSSRTMTYSSAVASYPARKPTPLFQPVVPPTQPAPRMPPPPLLAAPMHPQMIGLGRGNFPWPGGPPLPPHAWGSNGGPWMQQVPPPAMPLHFDHHHNPFYEIPPLGSSSGLDII